MADVMSPIEWHDQRVDEILSVKSL